MTEVEDAASSKNPLNRLRNWEATVRADRLNQVCREDYASVRTDRLRGGVRAHVRGTDGEAVEWVK